MIGSGPVDENAMKRAAKVASSQCAGDGEGPQRDREKDISKVSRHSTITSR